MADGRYRWSAGFHAPKGVDPNDVLASVSRFKEPTPEALLQASKKPAHVLHEHLWGKPDAELAGKWRREECRRIISSIEDTIIIGGKEIEIRAVEFVRVSPGGPGSWATIDTIMKSPEMLAAHLGEVERLQEQAAAKVARVRQLLLG